MLHSLRYASILKVLEKSGYRDGRHRIVEIGAGISGISPYIRSRFIGCDLGFAGKPSEAMMPVRCSVFALPFPDRSVDFIVSSDMMEHIQPKMRKKAIKEMLRVASKSLIMGFPEGERARRCDESICASLRKANKKVPNWLEEHMDAKNVFPTAEEIGKILKGMGARFTAYPNESLLVHAAGVRLENNSAFRKLEWWTRKVPAGRLWSPLLPLANIGPTYRKIFAVHR